MENSKGNNGIIWALIIIIILLLLLVYLLVGKDLLDINNVDKNTSTTTTAVISVESSEEKYNKYLENSEKQIKTSESENSNVISESNKFFNTTANFLINKNLELILSTSSFKLENYKISDNVLDMFLVYEGNGGYDYLYFIKTDGSLNKVCVSCLTEKDSIPKVENVNAKYIVNVLQSETVDSKIATYVDIEGNVINK